MQTPLSTTERQTLLQLARQSIETVARGQRLPPLELESYSQALREQGATFVTLTIQGELRGCVGALEPYQPLVEDVCEHAVAAAFQDYRFPPLQLDELPEISIEISRLTLPEDLPYDTPTNLPALLRPGVDGVTLLDGRRRATFLPQVWEKIPQPERFLDHLCAKMGVPEDLWRRKKLRVQVYQVEEFHE